jgi:hypothetical protein
MNKRIIILLFWFLSLIAIAYAVYRSTGQKITVTENGQQVVYGEPQHGLILGLCVFAGICVLSTVPLLLDRKDWKEEQEHLSKRTLNT